MTEEIKQRIDTIKAGKVPDGYKQTKFGVFPKDWATATTLGDIFKFYGGLGISREQLSNSGIEYLHYGDMHKGTFRKVSYTEYSERPKYDIQLTGNEPYLMRDGDVVFLDASEDLEGTSRCVLVDNPDNDLFISGLHTILGKPYNNSLEKWYKQYITATDAVKRQFQRLAVGFKVYGVNRKDISKIALPYPISHSEQKHIAEVLTKWDKAIELQEQLIVKLELQKKALMQKLLVPKENWKTVKMRDVFFITRGNVLATEECNDSYKYPVYSSQTKHNGLLGYYNKFLFENAITWTTDGANAGKVTYRTGKFYCTNVCGVLINDNGYANPCFAYILNKVTPNYVSYVGNPKLMNNVMGNITVTVPELKDQEKISKIIMLLDKKIEKNMDQLALFKQQQKAMQQLLLTGIVRV